MPVITEKRVMDVAVAHQCDCCGKLDENQFNGFTIDYTFGFDSRCDMTRVTAAICDNCLEDILRRHVPGAVFSRED